MKWRGNKKHLQGSNKIQHFYSRLVFIDTNTGATFPWLATCGPGWRLRQVMFSSDSGPCPSRPSMKSGLPLGGGAAPCEDNHVRMSAPQQGSDHLPKPHPTAEGGRHFLHRISIMVRGIGYMENFPWLTSPLLQRFIFVLTVLGIKEGISLRAN